MKRLWALRTMAPDALMQYGIIHLRRVQAEGHGRLENPNADVVENVLAELADQLLTLQKEVDAGVYSRGGWPLPPKR